KFLNEFAFLIKIKENFLRKFMMDGFRGPMLNVESYSKFFERLLELRGILVNNLLWHNTFLLCFTRYRWTMPLATRDVNHILVVQPQETYENIAGNVCSRQMPNMQRAIGIG